jgi:hypothetical protein
VSEGQEADSDCRSGRTVDGGQWTVDGGRRVQRRAWSREARERRSGGARERRSVKHVVVKRVNVPTHFHNRRHERRLADSDENAWDGWRET